MIDPQRLVQADDEFERSLLRSAHDDRPSHRALERMLLGLGVELSHLSSAAASAGPGVTASSKLGGVVLAKWLLGGVALGLATISGIEAVGRATQVAERPARTPARQAVTRAAASSLSSPSRAAAPGPESLSSAARPEAPSKISSTQVREARAMPLPVAASAVPSNSARPALLATARYAPSPAEPLPATATALTEEMRLLEAARRSLASGDFRAALVALERYDRSFPTGALQPEASVLKVRALLAAGDRQGAETLGQHIVERAPRSEHADAVRAALRRADDGASRGASRENP